MSILVALFLVFIATGFQDHRVSSANLFSCTGRPAGYYADIQSDCQQYHVCTGGRLQYTYSCPNTTRFQQRMMICDHAYLVNCVTSEQDYSANLLLGQRGVPFVGADEFKSIQKAVTPPTVSQSLRSNKTIPNFVKPTLSPLFGDQFPALKPPSSDPKINLRTLPPLKYGSNTYKNQPQYPISNQPTYFQQKAPLSSFQKINEPQKSIFKSHNEKDKPVYSTLKWIQTPSTYQPTLIYPSLSSVTTPPTTPIQNYPTQKAKVLGTIQPPSSTLQPFFLQNYPLKNSLETQSKSSLSKDSSQISSPPETLFKPSQPFQDTIPRGFSTRNTQIFIAPTPETFIQTFATVSPILDIPATEPDQNLALQRLRSLKGVEDKPSFVDDNNLRRSVNQSTNEEPNFGVNSGLKDTRRYQGPSVKLEWTLPDTRAMLFIPDDPADAVVPNIKRYSVTIPQPKMVFKSTVGNSEGPCPGYCDPRFIQSGTCHPCIIIK